MYDVVKLMKSLESQCRNFPSVFGSIRGYTSQFYFIQHHKNKVKKQHKLTPRATYFDFQCTLKSKYISVPSYFDLLWLQF